MPATTPRPKSPEAKASQNGTGRSDVQFVRLDLTQGQKSDLKGWAEEKTLEEIMHEIDNVVGLGVVISLRQNETGYQCSGTGTREAGVHYQQCLVARASTPVKALYAWVYKDSVLLKHTWPVTGSVEDLDL